MGLNLSDLFTASNQSQGEPSVAGASEGGFLGTANDLTNLFARGADIYNSVKEAGSLAKQREAASKAAATVSTNDSKNNLILYLVLGGVAIVALIFFLRR